MEKIITESGNEITITMEHAASSYGQPVALYQGEAYGVMDMPPGEEPLGWLMEEMGKTVTCAAHRTGQDRQPLIRKYIDLWLATKGI